MKYLLIKISLIACVFGFLASEVCADEMVMSSTQPSGLSLKGQVNLKSGFSLDKSDYSRIVVYLDSDPTLDAASAAPTTRPQIAQINKQFSPEFLVISRGTTVEFPNWDHFSHDVFSRSAAAPAFDLDRYPYGQSKSREFDNAGVVMIFCDIHPFMKATIFVTPNRYSTTADEKGNFTLAGVPAGKYSLVAWQERCGKAKQSIDVAGNMDSIAFTLSEDRQSILETNPPNHGDNYGLARGLNIKNDKLNLPVVTDVHAAPTSQPCPDCN